MYDVLKTVNWPAEQQPLLVVVIDTEAEFDWKASGSRRAAGVTSVKRLAEVQNIFDRYGVRPTLVVDYPVSSTPGSYEIVRDLHASGGCQVGAHLQPWDTPPLVEETNDSNSYPGNLPPAIEREKLTRLTEAINQNVGVSPRIYKAGRYGLGPATPAILRELGYEIDVSVLPHTDLSRESGPNFSAWDAHPCWFGADRRLFEIPLSIGYTGPLSRFSKLAHVLTTDRSLKRVHVPGILSHLRLLDRVTLTPEGITLAELQRLTHAMLRRGYRVLSFSYHSPSLVPGYTPYVRNSAELRAFLQRIEQYLEFFMGEIGGRPATPFEIRDEACRLERQSSPQRGSDATNTPHPSAPRL